MKSAEVTYESIPRHFIITVIKRAGELIKKYGTDGLRTLDSIQFACAVKLKDDDCSFFTSDKLLRKLFKKESLRTVTYDQDIPK